MASDLRPALLGSLVLHLSFLAAGLIVWPQLSKPLSTSSVTVKLVARAPVTDVRPAIEAPEAAPAAAPEPAPVEPPPEAAPPPPAPVSVPTPVPAPPAPAPPKPPSLDLNALASTLPKPQPRLDLNALAKPQPHQQARLDLNALAKPTSNRANAAKGPLRPETAVQSRTAAGAAQGLSADEASLLASKLNRLWNPNCGAEGAANVSVKVNIRLTAAGTLAAPPALVGGQSSDPVWQAAAQRALTAVARGAPYDELPRDRFAIWKDINFNFDGREACRRG